MLNLNSIFPCLYYKVATPNHIQYILYFQRKFFLQRSCVDKGESGGLEIWKGAASSQGNYLSWKLWGAIAYLRCSFSVFHSSKFIPLGDALLVTGRNAPVGGAWLGWWSVYESYSINMLRWLHPLFLTWKDGYIQSLIIVGWLHPIIYNYRSG